MNQEKIGKFIAKCRKENGYTQASLAEKLGITDRAISKWENGKSMPDASIMLELCELLKINVNELLTGEHIIMDNYKEVKANKKEILIIVVVFVVMLLFACFAGENIGEALGRFIYNITH